MSLHVETVGDGPPLVLLHGWALHSGLWQPIVGELSHRYRVHLVDLPGHGHSAPVAPYTLDGIVALLHAHFAPCAQPLFVLGWSFGGQVALRWARAHPDDIERLVLLCTSPCFVQRAHWPQAMDAPTLTRFGDELALNYRATLLRFLSLQVKDSERGRASLALLRSRLFERGEPSGDILQQGLRLLAQSDLRSEVPAINRPALVMAGDRDMLTPLGASEWLAQTLPSSRLEIFRGAGHAPFLSHPEPMLAALNGFLSA